MKTIASSLPLGLLTLACVFGTNLATANDLFTYDNMLSVINPTDSITSETTELLGERVDLNTGALSFSITDIDIPGNSVLPVRIGRVYRDPTSIATARTSFSDWALDIPHISTTLMQSDETWSGTYQNDYHLSGSWGQGQECSGKLEGKPRIRANDSDIKGYEFYGGENLHVPGQVSEKILEVSNGSYPKVTKSNWRIRCENEPSREGERFVVQAPDGTTYTFAEKTWIFDGGIRRVDRKQVFMLVSQITDRFGNSVTYHYDKVGIYNQSRLTRISANDGRLITLTHHQAPREQRVKSITTNGRTWQYKYSQESTIGPGAGLLSQVILPDGRAWSYDLKDLFTDGVTLNSECNVWHHGTSLTGSLTHPSGLKGTFTVGRRLHGQSNVRHLKRQEPTDPIAKEITKPCHQTMSLVNKTLTGPGLSPLHWSYDYSENNGFYDDKPASGTLAANHLPPSLAADSYNYKSTTVTSPDSSQTVYYHNRDFRSALQGQLVATNYLAAGNRLLKRVLNQYTSTIANTVGSVGIIEYSNNLPAQQRQLLTQVTTELHYVDTGAVDTYTTQYSDFNTYGVARKTVEFNSFNHHKRYSKQTYAHNTTKWLLNLPTTTEVSSTDSHYTTTSQTTYNSNQQPYEQRSFGVWQTRSSYHADGNLNTITLNAPLIGGGNRYVTYSNYYRGTARAITVPQRYSTATMSIYKIIDANGWLTQSTDFDGQKINYGYNNIGRLTAINPANGLIADTYIRYANGPQQTISRCTLNASNSACNSGAELLRMTRTFDALYRPTLTTTTDVKNNHTVYQQTTFNTYGNPKFQSYPSASASEKGGSNFNYDGLQRQTSHSIVGGGSQNSSYATGNKITVSNFNNHSTTTTYLAYGAPSYDQATRIASPENVTTTMTYNVFGNMTWASQAGVHNGGAISHSQHMAYDSQQRLCKLNRKDVGQSVYGYHQNGQLAWQANGTSGGSNTDCLFNAANKTTFSYDNGGAQYKINYPDSISNKTPDRAYTLSKHGDLTQLTSGSTVQSYGYNSARQLTSETLAFNGKNFRFGYSYSTLGHLASTTYLDSYVGQVNYHPNAFGQATQAQGANIGYASAATYYPNGTINSFNYGNGVQHKTSMDAKQRPIQIHDFKGSTSLLKMGYSYDHQNNIKSITDHIDGNYTLSKLNYDGLDRLTSTVGGSGIGSSNLSYDSLGNITSYASKNSVLTYNYDKTKNRLTSTIGSNYQSYGYDAKGNVTQKGGHTYRYNDANQLTQVSGNTSASYLYDSHNRRIKSVDANGTTYSFYNHQGKLLYREEHTSKGHTYTHSYIYLGNKYITEDGLTPKRYNTRRHYKPFGETIETATNNIGYTGHKFDVDTGLVYMQQRYMDPASGRFMSNDPMGFSNIHNFNRYAYGNNNPYKFIDPDGSNAALVACYTGPLGCAAGVVVTLYAVNHGIKGTTDALKGYNQYNETTDTGSTVNASDDPVAGILEGAKPTGKKGEYTKGPGGEGEQAQEDFNNVTEGPTRTYDNGTQVGKTVDGRTVDLHGSAGKSSSSNGEAVSQGTPTIKIRNTNRKVKTTIRYVEKKE